MSCKYNGLDYSDGSLVCMAGKYHRCRDGVWHETGEPCREESAEQSREEIFTWLESLPQFSESADKYVDISALDADYRPSTITRYSNAARLYLEGGSGPGRRLFGRWAYTRGEACRDEGTDGWVYVDDIIERPGAQSCFPETIGRSEKVTIRVAPRARL